MPKVKFVPMSELIEALHAYRVFHPDYSEYVCVFLEDSLMRRDLKKVLHILLAEEFIYNVGFISFGEAARTNLSIALWAETDSYPNLRYPPSSILRKKFIEKILRQHELNKKERIFCIMD
jgi:hypothetical protein